MPGETLHIEGNAVAWTKKVDVSSEKDEASAVLDALAGITRCPKCAGSTAHCQVPGLRGERSAYFCGLCGDFFTAAGELLISEQAGEDVEVFSVSQDLTWDGHQWVPANEN